MNNVQGWISQLRTHLSPEQMAQCERAVVRLHAQCSACCMQLTSNAIQTLHDSLHRHMLACVGTCAACTYHDVPDTQAMLWLWSFVHAHVLARPADGAAHRCSHHMLSQQRPTSF